MSYAIARTAIDLHRHPSRGRLPGMARRGLGRALAAAAVLVAAPLAAAEAEINARWQGAWVLTRTAARSDCAARYTNNEVRGDLVVGDGRFSFAPGELAQVAKVNVNRRRIEVLLDLAATVLAERVDGPFTLFDEAACRVELRLPRSDGDDATIERSVAAALERHATPTAARDSDLWNERRRADYPDDYERTLEDYEIWRAQQVNLAVQARLDEAIDEAARIARRIDDEPDYLAGLAAGIEQGRGEYYGSDCSGLLSKDVDGTVDRAPSGRSSDWEEGYEDGQRLLYFTEMARRLRACFAAPPS